MLTLKEIKKNELVNEFINRSRDTLFVLGYTDHGIPHSEIVSQRARTIAKEIGLSKEEQEMSAIAGYLHDFANFLSRDYHHYFGSLLFIDLFKNDFPPHFLSRIAQAISNHDKYEMKLSNPVIATLVIADKSHVSRERVLIKDINKIKRDIHNRVNYAVKDGYLRINKNKKLISLILNVDTNFIPIMEYFEIFTDRMVFCRKAAEYLGYRFGLVINNFKLL
jgi:metal-dependent HD superfamily phosphatase/phosphodiesterase